MEFKNRTFLASLAATLGVVVVAGLGLVALGAQQGIPQGPPHERGSGVWGGPGGRGPGMFGGPGGRGPMAGMMRHGLTQLNLTAEQEADIKKVMESNKADTKAIAERMIAAREALGDAVTADTPVETDIRAKAAAVAAVEVDGALVRAKVHAQVFALLTTEQRAKANQLRVNGKGRIKQMLGRMLGRGGRGGRGPGGPSGLGGIGGWF